MIFTPGVIGRLALLGGFAAIAQIVCFSKMDVFGTSPSLQMNLIF